MVRHSFWTGYCLPSIGQVSANDQGNLLLVQFLHGDLQGIGLTLEVDKNGGVHTMANVSKPNLTKYMRNCLHHKQRTWFAGHGYREHARARTWSSTGWWCADHWVLSSRATAPSLFLRIRHWDRQRQWHSRRWWWGNLLPQLRLRPRGLRVPPAPHQTHPRRARSRSCADQIVRKWGYTSMCEHIVKLPGGKMEAKLLCAWSPGNLVKGDSLRLFDVVVVAVVRHNDS